MYRFLSLILALSLLAGCGQPASQPADQALTVKSGGKLTASASNSITTSITRIVSQPNMSPLSSNYQVTGIQSQDLETTAGTNSTTVINDGIGVVAANSLNMLYLQSDSLDATAKFYALSGGSGSQVGNTITLTAGVSYEWDSFGGVGPLSTSAANSLVITVGSLALGASTTVTSTNLHGRATFAH